VKTTAKLWIGLAALALLSPLGLILPEHFKAGAAWGEWSADEVRELAGYVPRGLEKLSGLWRAPLPDYAFNGQAEKGIMQMSLAYIVSAVVGIAVIVLLVLLIGKLIIKKEQGNK
jgi:hypothetical protein